MRGRGLGQGAGLGTQLGRGHKRGRGLGPECAVLVQGLGLRLCLRGRRWHRLLKGEGLSLEFIKAVLYLGRGFIALKESDSSIISDYPLF